jgi:hypothetical protein
VCLVKVLQNPGHESPTETIRVLGPHVGCGPTSVSCGCPCYFLEYIYFLIGLSHCGAHVTLTGGRGGGFPMSEYIHRYCKPEAERHKGKVAIRGV